MTNQPRAPHADSRPPLPDSLISVVLPVFNEAAALETLLARVRSSLLECGTNGEILFVDDGSTDGSGEILDRMAERSADVKVLHLSRNFGHQAAVQAGLSHARGDAVLLMDSDLQDAPEAFGQFLEQWQAGFDVVYAIRVARKEGIAKRFLFAAFHRLLSSVSSVRIPADAGNFSLLDGRVVQEICCLGERDRYLPGLRSWVGFRQIGVPVERNARYDDRPRVSLAGLTRLAKTAIFGFSSLPLAVFYTIGYMALSLFIGLSAAALYCRFVSGSAIPGWTSHILSASFFGALNALGISMLGEYVTRIYDQVRARPLFVIDRKVNFERRMEPTLTLNADPAWDETYSDLLRESEDLLGLADAMKEDSIPHGGTSELDAEEEPRLLRLRNE